MDPRSQGIRDQVTRQVFGPANPLDVWDEAEDDSFERSRLIAPETHQTHPQRLGNGGNGGGGSATARSLWTALLRVRFGRLAGGMAFLLLTGLLAGLLDPALPATILAGVLTAIPSPAQDYTPSPVGPLTAFDGWRIAYAGDDDRLYVATPDGHITLFGPELPGLLRTGGSSVASASPDGYRIAYATGASGLALIDLTGAPATPHVVQAPSAGTNFYWSPDGSRVAMTTVYGTIATRDVSGGRGASLPQRLAPAGLSDLGAVTLLGWLGNASLILARRELATDNTTRLDVVDALTGRLRPLAVLATHGSLPRFTLSSDGSKILAYGSAKRDGSPVAWVIDSASGRVRALPGISRSLDGPIVAAIWDADQRTLVAATRVMLPSTGERGAIHDWSLDTEKDFAVHQRDLGIPLGWMAENGPLVFGAWEPDAYGIASYVQLRAFAYTPRGTITLRLIKSVSARLSFVGFVRTR